MDELSVDQIAAIRSWIRGAVQTGHSVSVINARLNDKYPGVTMDQVMRMSGQDFARSMGQGLTLGHLDEITGVVAKLRGKDYATARDAMRNQDAESQAANPGLNTTVRMLSGAIPAVVSGGIPGLAMAPEASMGMNALRGAAQAGGIAAVDAAGNSNAPTGRGVASDMFSLPTALSAALGSLGGAVATKAMNRGLPSGGAGKVSQEGAALLPNKSPDDIRWTVARQEALAPGTTVAADLSPELQMMSKGVGADRTTVMQQTANAQQRLGQLLKARSEMGQRYDALSGQVAPVDHPLLAAVAATGEKGVLSKTATEVDLGTIQKLRSQVAGKARDTRNPALQREYRRQAQGLTDWLQTQWSAVKGVDSDYAFLTERVKAAQKTLEILKKSAVNHGVPRAYGVEPGSVGGSLPGPILPGGAVGTTVKLVAKIGATDKAARARQVAAQFLTPIRGTNLLEHLLDVHGVLTNPADYSGLNAARSAIFGGAIPVGLNQVAGPQR